jgi:hypothetical protein
MALKPGARSNGYFPRVQEAREALAEKARDILEDYLKVVKAAQDAGDYQVAAESLQWLMEHMPTSPEERGMLDGSVDKVKAIDSGPKAPTINIGIKLGGGTTEKLSLPAAVIDAEVEDE